MSTRIKKKPRLRAIFLALPFVFLLSAFLYTIYFSFLFIKDSFKVFKMPALYVLVAVIFFGASAHADAPRGDVLNIPTFLRHQKRVVHIQTPYEYVMSLPHGDIAWRIYGNESSFGTHTFLYCKNRGLVNDVGYNVLGNPPTCFTDFKSEMKTVSQWFDRILQSHTLVQSLCLYNEGKDENNCRYAQDFLHL